MVSPSPQRRKKQRTAKIRNSCGTAQSEWRLMVACERPVSSPRGSLLLDVKFTARFCYKAPFYLHGRKALYAQGTVFKKWAAVQPQNRANAGGCCLRDLRRRGQSARAGLAGTQHLLRRCTTSCKCIRRPPFMSDWLARHRKERFIHTCVSQDSQRANSSLAQSKSHTRFPNDQETFRIMFSKALTTENLDLRWWNRRWDKSDSKKVWES